MTKQRNKVHASVYGIPVDNVLYAAKLTESQLLDMLQDKDIPPPFFIGDCPYWSVKEFAEWLSLRRRLQNVNKRVWLGDSQVQPDKDFLMGLAVKQAVDAGRKRP